MKLATPGLSDLEHADSEVTADLPPAAHVFAPSTLMQAAKVFEAACKEGAAIVIFGGGSHQKWGHPVEADVILSTRLLDQIEVWEPDDLTAVVQAGVRVDQLESALGQKGQTAGLVEGSGPATVGGVVAVGASGYRRARLGPTRDRLLQVQIVTGDGRIVTGGARVVKNVSGYDLPRLAAGSYGALGLIGTVCLKLWPVPEQQATLAVNEPARARRHLYRPLAVLESDRGSWAYVQGTAAEVAHQAASVGADPQPGLKWPDPPVGRYRWQVRVPPAELGTATARMHREWSWVAQHGVGVVDVAAESVDGGELADLRGWAEHRGGSVVITDYVGEIPPIHPFGTPPSGLDIQRRLMGAFDPLGLSNPGRLLGAVH